MTEPLFVPGERVRLLFHTDQRPLEGAVAPDWPSAWPIGLKLLDLEQDGEPVGPTVTSLDDGRTTRQVPTLVPMAGVARLEYVGRPLYRAPDAGGGVLYRPPGVYPSAPERLHTPWSGGAPPPAPAPEVDPDDRKLFHERMAQRTQEEAAKLTGRRGDGETGRRGDGETGGRAEERRLPDVLNGEGERR